MVSKISSPNRLSPDGFGRFLMMTNILDSFYGGSKKTVKLLDVGGGSPFMTSQLKDMSFQYNLTAIDILPEPKGFRGTYVQGDATKMLFDSNTFDTVITTDVLEHIPLSMKKDFVKECIRVAKDYVVIAAPFNTEGVDAAEHATNDFNVKLFNADQTWLKEHFKYKKPELSQVLKIASDMGCETKVIGTNNLYHWLLSTHVNLIEAKLGLNSNKHIKSNVVFNEQLLTSGDMMAPHYRHFIVISKNSKQKKLDDKLQKLASPKIDHTASVTYFSKLMTLIADQMIEAKKELAKEHEENIKKQKRIDDLQEDNNKKQAIIDRCGPYIKLLSVNPKKILKYKSKPE